MPSLEQYPFFLSLSLLIKKVVDYRLFIFRLPRDSNPGLQEVLELVTTAVSFCLLYHDGLCWEPYYDLFLVGQSPCTLS